MAIAVPTAVVTLDAIEVAVEVTTDCMPGDVVGQPGLDLAAAGAGEEGERLALEVAEDVGPQAVHDLLADAGGDEGLAEAEHGGRDGDGEHPADREEEQPDVLLGEGVVDDQPRRNGEARETAEDATMSATTRVIRARKGAKREPTRRQLTGDSASWARSAGSTRRGPRPPP